MGVFSARRRAAVLVDFDNVESEALSSLPNHWTAWLAEGAFAPGWGRRRFVMARVYWNDQHDGRKREKTRRFEGAGFEFRSTRSVIRGKSTSDTMIAYDLGRLSAGAPAVDEVLLLSSDSDFIPLVEALRDAGVRVAVFATPSAVPAYRLCADAVIDEDELVKAAEERAAKERRRRESGLRGLAGRMARRARPNGAAGPTGDVDLALAALVADHMRAAGLERLSKSDLRKLLESRADFTVTGPAERRWLGCGDHKALMHALADRRQDMRVADGPKNTAVLVHAAPSTPPAQTRRKIVRTDA